MAKTAMASAAALAALVWLAALAPAGVARAQAGPPGLKTVDTGIGFTISVPESWSKGQPSGNNKFVMGNKDDDFAVVVADFGPVQTDAAAASAVYRESFKKSGLDLSTESDVTISGKPSKRYVFAFKAADGAGHAEAVMVSIGDATYAVLVVTPAAALEARRAVIGQILGSVALKP